jgi:transposase
MAFLGIDLHTNNFKVSRLEALGKDKMIGESSYTFEEESFKQFLNSLEKDDYILVEASTNTFWFYDQVRPYVKECYIYNVNKGNNQGNKTDKIDGRSLAKKLAFYVLLGEEFDLPLVYVPCKEARELRSLVTTYRLLLKMITQSKNRIHALLKQNGICIKKSAIESKHFEIFIDKMNISNIYKSQIKCLMRQLENTKEEQKNIKDIIYILGEKLYSKEIKLLLSIKGFSPFTAIVLMSDVVDINRFKSSKKFCAYLRTAPKIKESNNTARLGHINKQSRKATCAVLTQSVNHFKLAGDHMSSFYNRVKQGKSAGKSRMALIRKILVCVYHMLKKGEQYYWIEDEKYQEKLKEYYRELNRIEEKKEKFKKVA